MKKILLATTALGMLLSVGALADGPTVTLGGYADFQVGGSHQSSNYDKGIFSRDVHSRTDTEITLKIDGKADNGLGYGAFIDLAADTSDNDSRSNDGGQAKRTYIYGETAFGRVELGSNGDAANALRVDASTFARGSGGVGGDWYHYADLDNESTSETLSTSVDRVFYVLPGLPTAVMPEEVTANVATFDDRANANKISYYTPRIAGVQVGLSFTPDQDERGSASGFSSKYAETGLTATDAPGFKNVWNGGINFQKEFQGTTVEASATGDIGSAKDKPTGAVYGDKDGLQAYALGLSASRAGFTLGGSWAKMDEFGRTEADNTTGEYWTVGAAYEHGPIGASIGYLNSKIDSDNTASKSTFNNLTLSTDYQLAPGLVPYAELSFFDTNDKDSSTNDNSGSILLLGTEVNF
jgi:outer membrane protein OmpU